jgi:hypothetical protein
MPADLNAGWAEANSKVEALSTNNEVSQNIKSLKKDKGNSLEELIGDSASQLNKIKEQQKRFQREVPTSMDQLLNMITKTKGGSSDTFKYLRKKVLQAMVKMEPKAREILVSETIKTLGCSQEQTYPSIKLPTIGQIPYIQQLPVRDGIYIPVNSIDFIGNLKIKPDSVVGKFFYEKPEPAVDTKFKPYGGKTDFPFNKMLNFRMENNNVNRNFSVEYGQFYNGKSEQNLLDIQYTPTNDLGVSGDFFRVFLLNKSGQNTNLTFTGNSVGQFLNDYYSTIKLVDPVNVAGSLMNYASNAVSIKAGFKFKRLSDETRFERIITRILGLCEDDRKEIDVSGVAKISELDGVDDTFFELNEADLRILEKKISNIQLGIVTYESCGDVNLPVDADAILDDLVELRDTVSGKTPQQTVIAIENIIDNYAQNPSWKPLLPNGVNAEIAINKNIIKDLPKAVASGILTPKVLLPVFVMYQSLQITAKNSINNLIKSANTFVQSANTVVNQGNNVLQSGTTIGQEVDNIIDDSVDFLKKFKEFVFAVVRRINEVFLRELFDILKKDILNLLDVIIGDISRSAALKKYTIILRLIQLGLVLQQLISNYRSCKSLVDSILNLLKLINGFVGSGNEIPKPLLPLTALLPGTSPERARLNIIEGLQSLGLPTGPMPDGSPNLTNVFVDAMVKGMDKEENENGTIDAMVLVPPITGGILKVFGKKR